MELGLKVGIRKIINGSNLKQIRDYALSKRQISIKMVNQLEMPQNVKDIIRTNFKYSIPDEHIELQDSNGSQYRIIFLTLPTQEQVVKILKDRNEKYFKSFRADNTGWIINGSTNNLTCFLILLKGDINYDVLNFLSS